MHPEKMFEGESLTVSEVITEYMALEKGIPSEYLPGLRKLYMMAVRGAKVGTYVKFSHGKN